MLGVAGLLYDCLICRFGRVWCDLFVLVGWRFYCGFRIIAMLVASYAGVLWLGCWLVCGGCDISRLSLGVWWLADFLF